MNLIHTKSIEVELVELVEVLCTTFLDIEIESWSSSAVGTELMLPSVQSYNYYNN